MKRTLILPGSVAFPLELQEWVERYPIYDSSCSPNARVFLIDHGEGLVLKKAAPGALKRESQMTAYFHNKGLGAQVLRYQTGDADWLLTTRVPGNDCLDRRYLEKPDRLCEVLAGALRMLHSLPCADCPVKEPGISDGVLIHGDYCLPNVMLDDWRLSGFVDVGDARVGDRHVDLYWGMWSLAYNLHTDRYGDRFLDAYGRGDVDPEMLQKIARQEEF